jgi:hypothetical protein
MLPYSHRRAEPVCAHDDPQDRGRFVYRVILTMRPGRAAHHRRDANWASLPPKVTFYSGPVCASILGKFQ